MRLIALSALPALTVASSVISARQAPLATITSVTSEGPACPPGSMSSQISDDGSKVTVIFSAFRADFQLGVTPPGERDLDCDVVFHLNFPIGCTKLIPDTIYRGYVQIDQGGVTGDLEPSYVLSGGKLTGVNTTPTKFDSKAVKDFLRDDTPNAEVTIRNPNEQGVRFESRTRMRVITTSSDVQGVVYLDSIDLNLRNQQTC